MKESAAPCDDELARYRRERGAADLARMVERFRPLVVSVCRRWLRQEQDVEDAVQETFMRMMRQTDQIRGSAGAWLAATARSVSVDLVRRAVRERRRREEAGRMAQRGSARPALAAAIGSRIEQALASLDEAGRQRVVERYFQKLPLRALAEREQTSVATMSRRVGDALADLAAVLRDMGVESAGDAAVAEYLDPPLASVAWPEDALRFAPDWGVLAGPARVNQQCLPGWSRPIRVGAMVSHLSVMTPGYRGIPSTAEAQVKTMALMLHPGFEAVGIAEPGTTHRGPVERTLRDYALTGGLIDSEDADQLRTLDVILLGSNTAITRKTADALVEAVRGGVGMINEFWTGTFHPGGHDPNVRALMLADSPIGSYHEPAGCGVRRPATVREGHQLLPGLRAGDELMTYGCGPVYRPAPGARVLVEKEFAVPPAEHGVAGLGPARMPVFLVGTIGRGRVAAVNDMHQRGILARLAMPRSEYLYNLFEWLATPRRELN